MSGEHDMQTGVELLRNITDETSLDHACAALDKPGVPDGEEAMETGIQCLMDLGYIETQEVERLYTGPEKRLDLERAAMLVSERMRRFMADDPALADTLTYESENAGTGYRRTPYGCALRLERLTSFDGDHDENRDLLPPYGSVNACSRSLHYRLRTLGLYHGRVDAPLSARTDEALDMLITPLGVAPSREEARRLVGDVRLLAEQYLQTGSIVQRMKPLVTPSEVTGETDEIADYGRLLILDDHFIHADETLKWQTGFQRLSDAGKKAVENLLAGPDHPEQRIHDIYNWFGQRLLQTLLWMNGFYRGRLDLWWGSESQQALESLTASEEIPVRDAMRRVSRRSMAVNLPLALQLLGTSRSEARVELKTLEMGILEQSAYLREQGSEETDDVRDTRSSVFKTIWSGVRNAFRGRLPSGRTVYMGVRSLLLSAVQALRRGINWITGALTDMAGSALSLARTIFIRVHEAVSLFIESAPRALHFIFRRPVVTHDGSGVIVSRFDLDADVITFVSTGASDALITRHSRICRALAADAGLWLSVAAVTARTVVDMGTGVGWLRLGFRIGSLAREIAASLHQSPA